MTRKEFIDHFTKDKPIIFNFHGYPDTVKRMFFGHSSGKRVLINGYTEEGSTTTPFDLQVRNNTSRYQLIIQACDFLRASKVISVREATNIKKMIQKKISDHQQYVKLHGVDPDELTNWKWGEYPAELA